MAENIGVVDAGTNLRTNDFADNNGEVYENQDVNRGGNKKPTKWSKYKMAHPKCAKAIISGICVLAAGLLLTGGHFIGSGVYLNGLVDDLIISASQTASDVNNGLDEIVKKAQTAQTAAEKAMDAANNIETLEDAKKAYKLASSEKRPEIEMLAANVDEIDPISATSQAYSASQDANAAMAKVQAAIDKINELLGKRDSEELRTKKLELEKYLEDHSQNSQVLLLSEDEDASVSISLKDAHNIAEQAYETAQNAAAIAVEKIVEFAEKRETPNEITFDISTEPELAKLVRGSHAGKVTKFLCGQYAGNILALYFSGNDGWGNDAIYEVKVDTENAANKFVEGGSADYADEIKELMKEQKPESGLYANILDRGNYISIESEVKKTSTMISYSTLSKNASGNFVVSEKVTLQEKGQLSEEDVIAKVVSAVEKTNASYVLVVDGEEIDL